MVTHRVRNGPKNLVRLEIAQINPRDAVVRVIVHEEPAPVVFRRRLRQPRMVHVPPRIISHHLLRFLIETVTGRRIWRENGNGCDVAHRWDSRHEYLAGMSAGIEEIVLVLLAGSDVGVLRILRAFVLRSTRLLTAAIEADDANNRDRGKQVSGWSFHCLVTWFGNENYFTVMTPLVPWE